MTKQGLGDLNLNLFRVFDAVFRLQSQTLAAAELGLTQPAVSNALSRLREAVNDQLFVRSGQRVAPTATARTIAPAIAQAMQLLEESLAAARVFDSGTSTRRFRIGAGDAVEQAMSAIIFEAVRNEAPGVSLDSIPCSPEEVPALLSEGELDVALAVIVPDSEGVASQIVARDNAVLAMRRSHPLTEGELTMARWLSADHLVVTGQTRKPTPEDVVARQFGIERRIAVRCQTYQAAGHLLAGSDLVALVPSYFATQFKEQGELALVPFPIPIPPLEIALHWANTAQSEPGNMWLRDLIIKCLGKQTYGLDSFRIV